MKKQDILSMLQILLVPVLLILLGLILVVNPDAASAMIAKVVGYALITGAIGTGLTAVFRRNGRIPKGIAAVVLAVAGGWLVSHPLVLAAWIGRFLGVLILINSIPDLIYAHQHGRNILFDLIAAVIGGVLILLPMTASRFVFSLCGAAVLVIGVVMLLDRLRSRRWLTEGDDPDIIDAL